MSLPTRRTSKDPLVRALLSSHKFNLLSVPRERADVYDLYLGEGRKLLPPDKLLTLYHDNLDLPEPVKGERFMAPEREFSMELEIGIVARLSGKLFAALGGSMDEGKFSGELKSKGANKARIRFYDVVRDHVGPLDIHVAISQKPVQHQARDLLRDKRIYLVVGVVRAKGLRDCRVERAAPSRQGRHRRFRRQCRRKCVGGSQGVWKPDFPRAAAHCIRRRTGRAAVRPRVSNAARGRPAAGARHPERTEG